MFDSNDSFGMHTLILVLVLFNEKLDSLIISIKLIRPLSLHVVTAKSMIISFGRAFSYTMKMIDTSFQWIDSVLCPFIFHSATQTKTKERIERQELISDRSPDNYVDVGRNVFVLQEHVDKRTRAEYTRNVHQSSCWQVKRLISRAM